MNRDELTDLLQMLTEKTAAGRLQWTETSTEDAFVASLESGIVRLLRGREVDYEHDVPPATSFTVSLLSPDGLVADEASFVGPRWPEEGFSKNFLAARRLWERARAKARSADQLLQQILQELRGQKELAA